MGLLKGTYKLGKALIGWDGNSHESNVTFRAGDGNTYYSITTNTDGNLRYDNTVAVNLDTNTWSNENLRTIIVEGEQGVEEWLSDFIETNTMKTISGKWKFKRTVDMFSIEGKDYHFLVNFTSNGQEFKEMNVDCSATAMDYITVDGQTVEVLGNNKFNPTEGEGGYGYVEYQTVDFGDVPQEVDGGFYSWFTANATRQELIGTYYFNENLATGGEDSYHGQDDMEEVPFYVGNEAFTAIAADSGGYLKYYKTDGTSVNAYDFNYQKWEDEKYRTITFVENSVLSDWWLNYIQNNAVSAEELEYATVSVFMGDKCLCTFKKGVSIVLKCKDMMMPDDVTITLTDPDPKPAPDENIAVYNGVIEVM